MVTGAVLLAAVVSLVLDRWLRFNLPTRLGLLAIAVAAILAVIVQKLIRPLLVPLDDLDLAELLDRRAPGVGQRISNVLQLPALLEDDAYASPSMVRAAVAECVQRAGRDRPDRHAQRRAPPPAVGRVHRRAGARRRILSGVAGHRVAVGAPLAGRFDHPLAAAELSERRRAGH